MLRVYHTGAAGRALPLAGPDPEGRAVRGHPRDPRCVDRLNATLPITSTSILMKEGL
jgi:hypothetical protein